MSFPAFRTDFKFVAASFFTPEEVNRIREYSEQFSKEYEIEDTVRIVNTKQAGLYIKNNIRLVDIFWSRDTLVFVFDKQETKEAYELWCRRELY